MYSDFQGGKASGLDHNQLDYIDHQKPKLSACFLVVYDNCNLPGQMWSSSPASTLNAPKTGAAKNVQAAKTDMSALIPTTTFWEGSYLLTIKGRRGNTIEIQ
jgi:hypothetical protein